jgi:hypothetical protein
MKDQLMQLEGHQAGRVRLSDFHGAAFGFIEEAEYLREIGALDEPQDGERSVIVPNYISAPSNCIASSSFYSVCCISECESLLKHLENEIAAPSVDPQQLLKIVADMPSSTVRAPRKLPASVGRQLVEISDMQGGAVKLHSHLFSEWMHKVYPRECPRPHFSEGTTPMTADEWLESGLNATESTQEIPSADAGHKSAEEPQVDEKSNVDLAQDQNPKAHNKKLEKLVRTADREKSMPTETLVRAEDFELVVTPAVPSLPAQRSGVWAIIRIAFMVGLLASMGYLAMEKLELASSASLRHLNSAKRSKRLDLPLYGEKAFV